MVVQRALKAADFGMRQLADATGLKYGVIRTWAIGYRTPTPENIQKIAEGFRTQAEHLKGLAAELESVAAAEGDSE
jgi:transcriptional regulator with XRE-family HTH domain